MSKIAWIGTGVMGAPMAKRLQAQGHTVYCYNRTYEKAAALKKDGLIACETVEAAVTDAEYIFTMVGFPKDVEDTYLGDNGVFACAKKGSIAIDMTTSSPEIAELLYEKGKSKGIDVLDAPVSGGDKGAREGTLTIMVGGNREIFDRVSPLLSCLGAALHFMGKAGAGQKTKICNQICVAGNTAAYCEALAYAKRAGLDGEKVLEAISRGAAGSWQLENMAPRALKGDFKPGFYIKHFIKDMRIALQSAQEEGAKLKLVEQVLQEYEVMAQQGRESDGTQALYDALMK